MVKPKREEMDETDRNTSGDEYSPRETARRSEATLKRLLATPPKPHSAEPKRKREAGQVKAKAEKRKPSRPE